MFVDKVTVRVKAGDGGRGIISFRHEKYIDRGGPDGGDGGDGGDIIARASNNQDTLATYRYQKQIKAEAGQAGGKRKKHGKRGENLVLEFPVGTVITDEDGNLLADFKESGQEAVIAHGGKGGFGNAHFVSSTRQAPRISEKGEPGEELTLTLELKSIADVGLVGLPNAGKSTLLSSVSNAHPEIANYPFTTLNPHLGVVDIANDKNLLMADIPGLIEGASEGKGLGDEFLRHVERTSVLLHLIDVYQEDVSATYKTIQKELANHSKELAKKPQIVALTKIDGFDKELLEDLISKLKKVAPKKTQVFAISSHSKDGLKELLFELHKMVEKQKKSAKAKADKELPVITYKQPVDKWQVTKEGDDFVVTGGKIESFAKRQDFATEAGVQRMRDILQKNGVLNELVKKGIEREQKIIIGTPEIARLEY